MVLNTDSCPKWVVVRTASNRDMTGKLQRKLGDKDFAHRHEKNVGSRTVELIPGATRVLGGINYLETRLIPVRKTEESPLCIPYEVGTVCVDHYTKKLGTWRAQVTLEDSKTHWLVTLRDEISSICLFTATIKFLEEPSELGMRVLRLRANTIDENFPLNRVSTKQDPVVPKEPMSIWERIRNTTLEPDDDEC